MTRAAAPFARTDLLPTQLASYVRAQIVSGELRPGDRLVEQALAAECKVSRVPLREAFRILASEGLVVLSPHRGASVSPISRAELIELFEARAALEGAAAMTAALRRNTATVAEMTRVVRDMRTALKQNDRAAYYALAGDFHRALMLASSNSILIRLYEQIRTQLTRYQAQMAAMPDLPRRSISEHAEILKAIRSGDGARARARAEDHILGLVDQFTTASGEKSAEETPWTGDMNRLAG